MSKSLEIEKQFKPDAWLTFVKSLLTRLASYDIQGNADKFNVASIADWGVGGKPQGIEITSGNFDVFMQKLEPMGISEHATVKKNLEISELQLQELNHVLNITLKDQANVQCGGGELKLQGNFIKLSDFVMDNGKFDESLCTDGVKLKIVNVFALHTVVVDKSVDGVGEKWQINIVAPYWHVEGQRVINLDGKAGDEHVEVQLLEHGQLGFRRQKGFLGQRRRFLTRPSRLSYPSANGSDGRPGLVGGVAGGFLGIGSEFCGVENLTVTANGGKGGAGQDGVVGVTGADGQNADTSDAFVRENLRDKKFNIVVVGLRKENFIFYGKAGGEGGRGGNGGVGGLGGKKGTVKIYNLTGSNLPTIKAENGAVGLAGKGAAGGQGGKRGNDMTARFYRNRVLGIKVKWGYHNKNVITVNERAADGAMGVDNFNQVGLQEPEAIQETFKAAKIINDYKKVLKQALNDRIRRPFLMTFLKLLDSEQSIEYDTIELLNELKDTEAQSQILNELDENDLLYLYESIAKRTSEYAKQTSAEHKQVLSYLYTAVLSKIHTLKTGSGSNLIVDISSYLDLVQQNINTLGNLQDKTNKAQVLNHYRETYKSGIDQKIQEAEEFIDDQVIPEVDEINERLQSQASQLIIEILQLKEQSTIEKEELVVKRDKLENIAAGSVIAESLKGLGIIVKSILPIGKIVDDILKGAIKITGLGEKTLAKIESVQKKVEEIKNNEVQRLDKVLKAGSSVLDFLKKKFKNDQPKLDTIDEAIKQAQVKIELLQSYAKQIHETVIPLLVDIGKDLTTTVSELKSKSQVSLEVTKWKVQSALKTLKLQLQKISTGFKSEDDLVHYIENLSEAMTTLINIYDRIQNYQDQWKLAEYISDISAPTSVGLTDPTLSLAVNELEVMIRSNLVLDQYKEACNALAQNVFPFAHLYLATPMLPTHLQLGNDIQTLATQAAKHIQTIKSKVDEYKVAIKQHDKYINSGWFSSDYLTSKSFFVWSNENHKNIITRFLAGQKIVLNSDIQDTDRDAIKFNLVEIGLKSNNKTTQSNIDNVLRGFTASLTHMGNSYYRYNDKFYVITSDSQNIQYTFEKAPNGEPIRKNTVYDKIKNGDLMLSPYAMWEFQLLNSAATASFSDLAEYADEVHVELNGHGSYLTDTVPDLQTDFYYAADESLLPHGSIRRKRAMDEHENLIRDYIVPPTIDSKNNSSVQLKTIFDLHGNLALGQLVAGMLFNKKKSNSSFDGFVSSEVERNLMVDELAQKVLPALEWGIEAFGSGE